MSERLPPLQALAFFESAARLGSFTSAAKELQTTQPAVSQRIGQLEADLGVMLFLRQHRGVSLSEDGVRLYTAVRDSLNTIRSVSSSLRARRTRKTITIATDFGFASYWLMPRLAALHDLLPDTDVRIVSSQGDVDLQHDSADIAIAFGDGRWPGYKQEKLFAEQVVSVCSSAFLAAHPELAFKEGLATVPLLHIQSCTPARWLSWDDWFDQKLAGRVRTGRELTFNSYSLVIESALAGQGVALGWLPLIDTLLQSGQLVVADHDPIITPRGYYLVEPHNHADTAALRTLHQWIVHQCQPSQFNVGQVEYAPGLS